MYDPLPVKEGAVKLFVWHNPYRVEYGMSMIVAVAENLDEAKRQAAAGVGYEYGGPGGRHPFNMDLPEPDRVVDLPCAEWHMWSE